MCCGVGNLEVKHSNHRNVFMSTLDQADVDVMRATKTCVAATRFQYDYLNDDITDDGQIDYTLTNKLPAELRAAIAAANAGTGKKILVLINPPYAEAANSQGNEGKTDVAATNIGAWMKSQDYGYGARELFTQFLVRIGREMPTATVAMFSTLKYVNAPNFEKFREHWNAQFLDGFIVHSKAFDGLKGNFPIGFLIWKTNKQGRRTAITEIAVEVLDKKANPIGDKKFYNLPNNQFLSLWMPRLKTSGTNIPLKNAIHPQTNHAKVTAWRDDAIGYLLANSNDPQHAGTLTALYSSVCSQANGFYITPDNLWQAAIVFAVRRLIKPTWINDRDQFLQPSAPLSDEFKTDCLIWMLFNGSNLTASADGLEWNGRTWSIVNHFIPFTEGEVGAPERFESDFMVRYLATPYPRHSVASKAQSTESLDPAQLRRNSQDDKAKPLSPEALAVLNAGRALWQAYFAHTPPHSVREELKLNRADVGWYQIRNALKKRETLGDGVPVDFAPFEAAYKALSEKLVPQLYALGFLKP